MNIAIVGSQTFPALHLVEQYVNGLPAGTIVVTGGAKGVDTTAEKAARARGLQVIVHLPDFTGCKKSWEFTRALYERNQKIVNDCEAMTAFTEKPKGGTWDAVERANRKGISVPVYDQHGKFRVSPSVVIALTLF